jgi:hypothetical protein
MAVMTAMVVTVAMEDRLVGSEQGIEAMEAMEATVTESRVLAVVLAATREVGYSSARASYAVVDTNNRGGVATNSKGTVAAVVAAMVVVVKAHVFVP